LEQLLVRADGPALTALGVADALAQLSLTGLLSSPTLRL